MIKYILKISIYTFLLIGSVISNAQEKQLKKANQKFDNYSFIDAREAYIKVYEKGYKSADLLEKLGDSYYFNGDYAGAEKWYEELYTLEGASTKPEYIYRYAITLKTLKNYEASDEVMLMFSEKSTKDERAEIFIEERNYLEEISKNSGRFTIKNEDFNSELSDYAPSFYGEDLVISTNRDKGTATKRIHTWNNQPFSDLLMVTGGDKSKTDKFSNKLNTKFHESSSVFTKDGKTVYFTRNNFTDKKLKSDNEGINRLKLYKAVKTEEDNWEVTELPFNSDAYSVAHPALSVDETTLFFASDMKGGFGASDLYMVTIDGDSFGAPVNLGEGINTEGRETFPFISEDHRIYFASDGHPGLGGLDIFVADMYTITDFSAVYNVGKPVNGTEDDFTFIINAKTKKGYFASNRIDGKGFDDVYSFIENKPLNIPFAQTLEGVVLEEATQEPVEGVVVSLIDENGEFVQTATTDAEGKYMLPLESSTQYAVRYEKEDYITKEKPFKSTNENGRVFKDVETIKLGNNLGVTPVGLGDDLNNALALNPIYFDLDKSNIRPDAEIELQKVIAVMEKYPNLKIDVRSHTDSRANDAYNDALSKRRNKSTLKYLIEKGEIDASRLTGKGYGESKLVNKCSNGVECTEEEHQLNRRSEFIIVQ